MFPKARQPLLKYVGHQRPHRAPLRNRHVDPAKHQWPADHSGQSRGTMPESRYAEVQTVWSGNRTRSGAAGGVRPFAAARGAGRRGTDGASRMLSLAGIGKSVPLRNIALLTSPGNPTHSRNYTRSLWNECGTNGHCDRLVTLRYWAPSGEIERPLEERTPRAKLTGFAGFLLWASGAAPAAIPLSKSRGRL